MWSIIRTGWAPGENWIGANNGGGGCGLARSRVITIYSICEELGRGCSNLYLVGSLGVPRGMPTALRYLDIFLCKSE